MRYKRILLGRDYLVCLTKENEIQGPLIEMQTEVKVKRFFSKKLC